MNTIELRNAILKLSEPDYKKLVSDFGGTYQNREEVVRHLAYHPEHERLLCYLLGLPTEDEKIAQATKASASSARWSAITAAIVAMIAFISLVVTICVVLK